MTDRDGESPLYFACMTGKTEFVKLLLSSGASPNKRKYPLHAACRGQHYDSVKLLLEYNADVAVRDQNAKTALHHALKSYESNNYEINELVLQLLLDRGADVNATSKNGESPFYIVCSMGMTSIAKKMLERGAKVDGSSSKKLPLIAACRLWDMSLVKLLLSK